MVLAKYMRIAASMLALAIASAMSPARADMRVALVIGNANYDHVMVLKNPANDANLIAAKLRAVNFDVTSAIDLDKEAFDSTLRAFATKARNADVALLYYAGHAIQVDGVNWLIPRDADIRGKDDLALYAVNVAVALDMMRARAKVSIVVLDACRDNPFRAFQESATKRGVVVPGRGLARISSDGLADMLVVYSAKDGTQAEDGKGLNSPFALALANRISERGTEFDKMFREVRGDVLASTGNTQEPYEYGSRTADFYFVPPLSTIPVTTAPPPVDPKAIELALWNSVSGSNDVGELQSYLDQYPNGMFSRTARAKIAALNRAQQQTASPANTQPAQQQTAMAQSPPQQQSPASATTQGYEQGKISKLVAKALLPAQKAMAANDFQTALAFIKQAQQVSDQSEFDQYTINLFFANCYIALNDYPNATIAFEAAADSPIVDSQKATALKNALLLAASAKHYSKAIVYGQQLQRIGSPDTSAYTSLAEAYYFSNEFQPAEDAARKALETANAAGQTPQVAVFQILINTQIKRNDQRAARSSASQMCRFYPSDSTCKQL
jgi:uncharacterized caspase-like protein